MAGIRKHGLATTKPYKVWKSMKARCLNKNHFAYDRYGGRGITICDSWVSDYMNFKNDMGEKPEGYVLDRIDNDGGYNKENCRWIDRKTSQRNRRCTKKIMYNGKEITAAEFAEMHGLHKRRIADRLIKLQWTPEEVLNGREKKLPPRNANNGRFYTPT